MTAPDIFRLTRGEAPLLVSFPHSGTFVPPELAARMTNAALALPDTDWHVPRLYEFLDKMRASLPSRQTSLRRRELNSFDVPLGAVQKHRSWLLLVRTTAVSR